jgi:putative DNA methylase
MTQPRKKLIEVALPLEAINVASATEKSNPFLNGHPRSMHIWWARRPLAACRAVIFSSLVDDPDDPAAPPAFVQACRELDKGPNTTLHDTPRMRLFDFIETLVQWESTTDEKIIGRARELINLCTNGNPPLLLDPFAGGGSIPLEAQRLGLEAHASDLNPVAVMINKALIEIPPRFANRPPVNPRDRARMAGDEGWQGAAGLAADVRYYGEWMRERAWERIGHLYPKYSTEQESGGAARSSGLREHGSGGAEEAGRSEGGETVIAWLWTRTVKCPNPACGCQMPLVRSFELSKKQNRRAWVEPQIDAESKQITFIVKAGNGKPPEGTVNRRGARCARCGTPVPFDHIRTEGKAGRMGAQMMAIVTEGKGGRSYYAPTVEQEAIAAQAKPAWAPDTDLPEQALGFRVQLYGMTHHADLFTQRQLVALTTFSDLIAEAREQCYRDALAAGNTSKVSTTADTPLREGGAGAHAYAEAVSVYLALSVSRWSDLTNTICSWNSTNQNVRALFARQAIPMAWDFVEISPFGSIAPLISTVGSIAKILEALTPGTEGFAYQEDAARVNSNIKSMLVSTDPPYYDNIGYADLADFFYVWLRPMLHDIFPTLFSTLLVPKSAELVATPYRFNGDKNKANSFFESGLKQAFSAMRRNISTEFPLSVYYAFKQAESEDDDDGVPDTVASNGWETMLTGLVESGFVIDGTWPMRTERSVRSVSLGTNALASSIVLVCRPRPDDAPTITRRQFVDLLRRELPAALKELQSGNIAPVDLAQASIGPGMAIYSRYSKVLEPDGSALSVRTALGLINQELDAYLAEQDGEIDPDTRFAVAWFEQFGFDEGEFGLADVLARAKSTSVEGVKNAGVITAGRGKVRLLRWQEYDPGAWDPQTDRRLTVWEATHHLIERLNNHGEQGAGLLLAQLKEDTAAEARALAYRLYNICERKGWAEYARDYNALVVQWTGAQEQARESAQNLTQDKLI